MTLRNPRFVKIEVKKEKYGGTASEALQVKCLAYVSKYFLNF